MVVELCVASSGIVDDVKLVQSSGHTRLDTATIAGLGGSALRSPPRAKASR